MKLYEKICQDLRNAIAGKLLKPGDRILSINEMKEKYKVSHVTALRVYRELSDEGLINCKRGQGYFVCGGELSVHQFFGRIACFTRTMRETNNIDNYFNEINTGIMMAAAASRMDLIHPHCCSILNNYIFTDEQLDMLKKSMLACAEMTDGFLLDERIPDTVIAEVLKKVNKPAVMVNRKTSLPVSMIYPDHKSSLKTLIDLGRRMKYTQFIFCAGGVWPPVSRSASTARQTAFSELADSEDFSIVEDCALIPPEVFAEKVGVTYEKHRSRGRVLVIFTYDSLAEKLLPSFCREGKIPEDLGFAGLVGIAARELTRPALTTMRVDTMAMGMKSVELLVRGINGTGVYIPETVLIPSVFDARDSMN